MENINQVTYVIIVFFIMAIFFKALFEIKNLRISPDQKTYWINSILAFLVSNIGYLIASFGWGLLFVKR